MIGWKKSNSFSRLYSIIKTISLTAPFKSMYDERLSILVKDLKFKCFPSYDECLIYENKKYFSYWLKANKINHPQTDVFYFYNETNDFMNKKCKLFHWLQKQIWCAHGSDCCYFK